MILGPYAATCHLNIVSLYIYRPKSGPANAGTGKRAVAAAPAPVACGYNFEALRDGLTTCGGA